MKCQCLCLFISTVVQYMYCMYCCTPLLADKWPCGVKLYARMLRWVGGGWGGTIITTRQTHCFAVMPPSLPPPLFFLEVHIPYFRIFVLLLLLACCCTSLPPAPGLPPKVKEAILSEDIYCSPEASVLLASYGIQAEVGGGVAACKVAYWENVLCGI